MNTDPFEDALDSLGPDADARIDAKARANLTDPAYLPPDWVDDGPDPFGLDWAWENGPTGPTATPAEFGSEAIGDLPIPIPPDLRGEFKTAYTHWVHLPDQMLTTAAELIRGPALAGGLAGGNDQEIVQQWAVGGLPAWCFTSGDRGEQLANLMVMAGEDREPEVSLQLVGFLRGEQNLAGVSVHSLTALAIAAVRLLRAAARKP